MTSISPWFAGLCEDATPSQGVQSPSVWIEANVQLPGSARSRKFSFDQTPWTCEPVESACGGKCRIVTFVKPVQSGGTAGGEGAICYWLSNESGGDIQYNWEDDAKALAQWDKRTERILKACEAVMRRAPTLTRTEGKWKRGMVLFPHCNLTVQGVFVPENLDTDTITFQVNEEVHNWKPGHLAKAYNRTTAVWNAVTFNISNAGISRGQLHAAFLEGTQQHWEVPCPTCGKYHSMHIRYDPYRPQDGGLRYDADGCRLDDGQYDYNNLEPTIRYQFPCGHEIKDLRTTRRWMSARGRYSAPRNTGARPTERSYTLEAVSVDYIPWVKLIQEKHQALRAMRYGDPVPWWRYLAERECRFYDPEQDRPVVGKVVVNLAIKKDRAGMKDRAFRFAALDRQQGNMNKGELPHWWLVIRDCDATGNSLLVYEGKLPTDDDAADLITRHDVLPQCVVADSGDDTTHVYIFCLKHGYNAIKGTGDNDFAHPDGSRRIYSPERPLFLMANRNATRENSEEEPLFWLYSKAGTRERLHYLRGADALKWEVPGDVSKDYKEHMEAEELQERPSPKTKAKEKVWVQVKARNDLFVCECYIAMLMDMAGVLGIDPLAQIEQQH